jgi:hypothetical protein
MNYFFFAGKKIKAILGIIKETQQTMVTIISRDRG